MVSLVLTIAVAFGSLATTLALGWGPKLGLDLAGGLSVVYKPTTHATNADMQEVVTILSNRVNGLGVSGAQVNLQGKDVVVSVPGVKDAYNVLQVVGQTAQLLFRPVLCETTVGTKLVSYTGKTLPACGPQYLLSQANLGVSPNPNTVSGFTSNNVAPDPAFANIASTPSANDVKTQTVLLPILGQKGVRYILGPAQLTGQSVAKAVAQQDTAGAWVVNYTLTSKGSPLWDKVAQANFHQLLAIELDGVVQSAPLIQPTQNSFTSFGGTGQISGSFTEQSAKDLALAMTFGSLPVRLQALTTQTVSPTLGHSALIAGLGAGLAGLLLVLLYTILYYRALGLVIVLGLAVTAALLWAIISALAHTALAPSFNLAGVTGLIVSIGITVDSYIVYFERLKDEARAGRSVRSSVDRGFRSAWRTVLAADTVSLLAAVLLYLIAVGDVRGFAFFLGLSTLMDVVITWYFTRPLVVLLGRRSSDTGSALSMAAGIHAGVAGE
ncbi:MAG TPA: protein translocase subunit SecD [Acidimicrobiales bacterium]|jgi:preprotein translocase subunit SecD